MDRQSRLPEAWIDAVRRATDVPALVGETVSLHKAGAVHMGRCPFHDERTASLAVWPDHYHCFGCGAHGDAIGYVMESMSMAFREAALFLGRRAGLSEPEKGDAETMRRASRAARERRALADANEQARRAARQALAAMQVQRKMKDCRFDGHPYLVAKGFAGRKALVGEDERMLIPMLDGNRVASAQYVAADGAKRFHPGGRVKGCRHALGKANGEAWCVEGYATGLSVWDALRRRSLDTQVLVCFSASNLASVAEAQRRAGRTVYAVADHDESGVGETAAKRANLSLWKPPVAGMDANDYRQEHGADALARELLEWRYPRG